ncbi:phage tail sheath subtilisin-like domain-containing protein [Methylobacterium organophilum]|uniref:phage tail sheath subtilisin-like domain-containing protein n=1 Tax=Methylobacterium organophilum TaxID=410 RepID=UPI001F146715|nr:phage tail sheath subtilisin-like domain-containing protein [Methylobacterium organophilum]UMY19133.1 phage tail sheath subtilisin-like domain-containing protein [Methylobacterium organophilum]
MAAGVAFNTIPGNLLVPFTYFEVNSGGSPYQGQSRLLLIGQKLAGGAAPAGVPYGPVQSERELTALGGVGSMLVGMFRAARKVAPYQPIWILPLAEPAGSAAAGSLTVNTAPGITTVGVLRVCGVRLTIQVLASDTAATIAASIASAVNAALVPVTAAVDGTNPAKVNLTARHVGTLSNGLDVFLPAKEVNGLVGRTTIVALSGGTGVPSLTTPLANLGDDEFDWIALPYADATSLDSMRAFLSDVSGRWSPSKLLFGHALTAAYGSLSTLVTLGNSRNDRHVSILGSQAAPPPIWERTARLAALAAAHLSDAPELSRPLQTLELVGDLPPDDRSLWWSSADRQALYVDGISATRVTPDGVVLADRILTTEQVDANGVPDATFRDIETLAQMMFAVRFFRAAVSANHARQALVDDNPAGLPELTTENAVKMTLIHAYQALVNLGVLEKADLFAQFVVVRRDPNDASRLNAYLPVDVVNQLRVFAGNVTTYLQYQAA